MSPSLSVVADNDLKTNSPRVETVAERVRKLQAEAKALAKDHVAALTQAIADVEVMAKEIAEGGDAYPPGVRDLARRFVDDCEARVQTLEAITSRA
jgi:chorismate mutase